MSLLSLLFGGGRPQVATPSPSIVATDPTNSLQVSSPLQTMVNAAGVPAVPPQPQDQTPSYAFHPKHGFDRVLAGILDFARGPDNPNNYSAQEFRSKMAQAMAAGDIAGVAQYNPQLAEQLQAQKNLMAYRTAGLDLRGQNVDANVADKESRIRTRDYSAYGQLLGAANPQTYSNMRAIMVRAHPELDDVLPDTYDVNAVQRARDSIGQTVNQLVTLPIKQQTADAATTRAGASVTSAQAAANRAVTAASEAPSVIAKNNGQAYSATASGDRAYGKNGTVQTGSKPGVGTPASAAPAANPAQYRGKTVTFKNGQTWHSDGVKWTKQ